MNRNAVVSQIAHDACVQAPPPPAVGAWWQTLTENFAREPVHFDLALQDRIRVRGTAAVDVLLRTGAAAALAALAFPPGYNPIALRAAAADREFYHRFARTGDTDRFFVPPDSHVPVRVRRSRSLSFDPPRSLCESLKFESHFVPMNPRLRASYLRHEQNRYAHVRYWRHRHGPRPTVIAIHGFGAEGYALNQWFFALPWLYTRLGVDVAIFNLPFHGRRQTRFSPFSGHGFFAGGPSRINEAFAQAVHDFRVLVDYLQRSRGVEKIGVTGVSLGGFTTALLAATEPRLEFAIPNVPVVSLADIILEWQPLGGLMRGLLRAMGMTVSESRELLAVSSPLTYRPVLPQDRLMVIGGVGDRLAPPKHSRLLWEHWDRCRLHWFPGSHILHLDRRAYLREIGRFLADIGFIPSGRDAS